MTRTEAPPTLVERKRLGELRRRLFGLEPPDVRVGRYVIEELVGQGGFGSVYRGYDPDLQRSVAVKLLRDDPSRREGQAQILAEARMLARFCHPNVVAVYDVGVLDRGSALDGGDDLAPSMYIVMEYVEGLSLAEWLDVQPRPWALVLDTMMQAGEGLWAAHRRGVLHRDFKPQNVLVGSDGRTRVSDFGLACAREVADTAARTDAQSNRSTLGTRKDGAFGTPEYMSPEQHRGDSIDPRTDQFAFSASLFEAIYGELPFGGHRGSSLYDAKTSGVVRAQQETLVPKTVSDVILRGLRPRPEERFEDMSALLSALSDARVGPSARRARRRWVAVGAGLASLAVAGATLRESRDGCEARGETVLLSWDAADRRAIRAAFEASGSPIADDTYQRVRSRVDLQARLLLDARAQTCSLSESDEDVSRTEIEERHECLDAHVLELAETLRVFRDADATVVEKAIDRLGGLQRPDSCSTPQLRKELARSRAEREFSVRWARTHALMRAGRADAALAVIGTIVEDAERDGINSVEGRARLWMGRVLRDQRRGEEASLALTLAHQLGVQERDERLVADTVAELAAVEGVLLGHPAVADRLLQQAEVALARAGSPDESAYRLAVIKGSLAREAGVPNEAVLHFRHAQAIARRAGSGQAGGPWAVRGRSTAVNLADTLTILGEYERARVLLEPVLLRVENELGEWHPRVARILQSLAFVHARMNEHGQALQYARRALEIEQHTRGGNSVSAAWILNMVGASQIEVGLKAEAVATHELSLSLLSRLQGPAAMLTLRARMNLARAKMEHGDLEGARTDAGAALAGLAPVLGKNHIDLAYGYVTLGEIREKAGDVEGARTAFERALQIRTDGLGAEHPQAEAVAERIASLAVAVE